MIDLYTDSTPNGFKATIALEELALPYQLHHVRLDAGENRRPEFLALNPHGRIPVITDRDTGITVFESAAILMYLAEKTGQLLPQDPKARWEALTWLQFHSSSVAPVIGQRAHFEVFAPEPVPAAIERFRTLTEAAFSVVDARLATHPYLGGETYTIADIAHFGWMHSLRVVGFDFRHHRHMSAWHERVAQRPAVQKGITLPEPATAL